MSATIENMVQALTIEVAAINKNSRSSVLELRGGIRQGAAGSDTLYSFPLSEVPNLLDDSPVKIIVSGNEIDGTVVSIRNGVLTVVLVQDVGPQIPLARLVVNDSFLVERLRDRLQEIQRAEFPFSLDRAERVITNRARTIGQAAIPEVVFTFGQALNKQQKLAVTQSAGSDILYLWGPPGTGKTSTLAAVVHAFYLQGKSILIVSNTNVAVDAALERIADRLSSIPEFQNAAVLRFGPIVSDTLRAKYDTQLNLDRVVERHSAALVKLQQQFKDEATKIHGAVKQLEAALGYFAELHATNQQLHKSQSQLRQLQSQIGTHQATSASLYQSLRETAADLRRAQSMGAIRKFFAGLNEDVLRQQLSDQQTRKKNCDDCIRVGTSQYDDLRESIERQTKGFEECRRRLSGYPEESQCREYLKRYNMRLAQLTEDLNDIERKLQALREELLGKCRVLAATVYQSYLKKEVARFFDVVIVDEASMLALPMVYYASGLATEKVIVAGDFRQLPPIVMSNDTVCLEWLKRDVFFSTGIAEAVKDGRSPRTLVALDEQFRMQEDVCSVVNQFFYDNHLKTAAFVHAQKPKYRPFPGNDNGLLYVDTSDWLPWAAFRLGTYSRYNVFHALLIRNIAMKMRDSGILEIGEANDKLGIIAPYSAQCRLLAHLVGESLGVVGALYASTVHRFQGNERDTIIYDITDSIGARLGRFATAQSVDEDGARLLNVALSRARLCTVLVGNFGYLRNKLPNNALLRKVLDHFQQYGQSLDVSDCFPFSPEDILAGHQGATETTTFNVNDKGLTAFTAGTFFPAFEGDCRNAKREIIIFSPYMTQRGTGRWVELWRMKIREGVRVRLVVRPPGDQGGVLEHGLPEQIDNLREIGIVVDERARMHEKLAFIDGKILWDGSLNILSHRDTSESMLRIESPRACEQVGSFVIGRKRGRNEDIDLAAVENPKCASCGKAMVWNDGRYGIWFACPCGQKADESGRPKGSKGKQGKLEKTYLPPSSTSVGTCPQCGKPLCERDGKYGPFISCSGYPRCKYKPPTGDGLGSRSHAPAKPPLGPGSVPSTRSRTAVSRPNSSGTAGSTPTSAASQVSGQEVDQILQALAKADEPLGLRLLSVKSGIGERRLGEIIPVLLRQGTIKEFGGRYATK